MGRRIAAWLAVSLLGGAGAALASTQFTANLDESQENPPTGSTATGSCTAVLNDAETELTINCTHDVSGPTAAHIHLAPPGVNGPVVFNLGDPSSPIDAVWAIPAGEVTNLKNGDHYVNVHSAAFPGGEIRGQLSQAPDVPALGTAGIAGLIALLLGATWLTLRRQRTTGP